MCGHSRKEIAPVNGSGLLGCCSRLSCQAVSGTAVSPGVAVGSVPGELLPLASRPFLQLLLSAGVTLLLPGVLWAGWDKLPLPSGELGGAGGSEVVPRSQYNPKGRSLLKGNLSPPGCLHLKGAFCT